MNRVSSHDRRYTADEYFQIDLKSETRHEFVDGRIVDIGGSTDRHSHLTANLNGVIWSRLRGKPCQARDSNLRVRYGRRVQYGYPDALIVCGPPQFDPAAPPETTLLNPTVLIEVVSDTTEAYDRGRKFELLRDRLVRGISSDCRRPAVD